MTSEVAAPPRQPAPPLPDALQPRTAVRVLAGALLFVFTVWIHYEVKFTGRHASRSGTLRQLGVVKTGERAPEFSARDLDGREASLVTFRGEKVVVLDFWASWCAPCRMDMPALQALQEAFHDQGVEILTVNQGERPAQVRHFMGKKGYTLPVVLDDDGKIGDAFGVHALPTMVVVDKRGLVQWIHVGAMGQSGHLQRLLERLVAE